MFARFTNIRNLLNVNNSSAVAGVLNVNRHSDVISKLYTTEETEKSKLLFREKEKKPTKTISKAMKLYLERSKEYSTFMERETLKYELGRRHLANMMGEDPESFNELKIQRAIRYLFPSGIYDKNARPMMSHPLKIFGHKPEAAFDGTGRPYHFLFYTCKPNYYEILYNVAESIEQLNKKEDAMIIEGKLPSGENKLDVLGSTWLSKDELESKLLEIISDNDYDYLTKSLEALVQHPLSADKTEFIMKYRKLLQSFSSDMKIPKLRYDSNDRPFVVANPCKRKSAIGKVKVTGGGTGIITINGKDISFFETVQYREQCH
ncbi:mitochondrial ribosomal protein S9 [Megalopta genalis]|uniref:mitochondrial ribosomal protein S9 n=1 Tax=Megalopta genalis TaxID=115081 RepID=UPI003FD1F304